MDQRDEQAMLLAHLKSMIENTYEQGRARSLVITKLDEAELWLTQCERKT